ncbi:MAG: GC-type dockerin domain-anchored protein [Phycisphaerales bacterium JB060]
MQRLLDGWVVVAALVIFLSCAALEAYADETPRLGSWRQGVLTSVRDPDPALFDPAATIDAMRLNDQNVRIYDVNRPDQWEAFEAFLIEADANGIDVYAALQKIPDPTSGSFDGGALPKAIWFADCLPAIPIDPDCQPMAKSGPAYTFDPLSPTFVEDTRAWMLDYHAAYVAMAEHLSEISLRYPALKGMVIDDFDSSVASAATPECLYGYRMTASDVGEIYDACKDSNPDFEFWPVVYPERFGEFLATDGHILGGERGVRMDEMEFAAVDLDVRLPPLILGPGTRASLRFTHADAEDEGAPVLPDSVCAGAHVWRRVLVNGAPPTDPSYTETWPRNIVQPQSVRVERFDVTDLLDDGLLADNTITFRIDAGAPNPAFPVDRTHNGCARAWWRVWDVSLVIQPPIGPPTVLRDFDATYRHDTSGMPEREACSYLYPPRGDLVGNSELRCPDGDLPDDPVLGLLARRIVAGPTGAYSIRGVVDGVIACFYRQETTPTQRCQYGDPGEVYDFPAYAYDDDEFTDAIDSLVRTMDGRGLAMILRATPWPTGPQVFDPGVLERQIAVSGERAPMTLLFAQPLGLEYLDERRGVFFDPSPDPGDAPRFTARWPSGQETLDGWYQEWTIDPWDEADAALVRFTIQARDGLDGIWQLEIRDDAGALIGEAIDIDGDAIVERTIPRGAAGEAPITLRFELVGGVGNAFAGVRIAVEDAATGNLLELTDPPPVYDTNVSDVLRDAYDAQKRAYRALGCPADFDCDGELTLFDFLAFQNAFDAGDPAADFDGDGALTFFDFLAFFTAYDGGC